MNYRVFFLSVLLIFSGASVFASAPATDPADEADKMTKKEYQAALEVLKARVDMLRESKREADTRAEKKALRREIRDVRKEARQLKQEALSGGIYIGGGALLIIILLLILL